jgi:uncharacterized membrane protein YhiD involved in acid resistance
MEGGIGIGALIGWGLTVLAIVGGIILRDRQVMSTIQDGDDKLHHRINDTRDQYVRRDDLAQHIQRIEKTVDEMRIEMREQRRTNERLDSTLTGHTAMLQAMIQTLTKLVEQQQPPRA